MKKTLYIWIFISILAISYSCKNADDFLEKKPLGEYSEVDVWSDLYLVQTYVNSMYRNSLGFPFSIMRLSDFSDESYFTPDWGTSDFNKSLLTQDNLPGWESGNSPHTQHLRWDPLYLNVRRTNVFFKKIDEAIIDDSEEQEFKDFLTGEAYFMRGLTYHYLVSLFGGVPIITKAYSLTDDFEVPRNTYEECIDFIVGQLDSAAMYLPLNGSEVSEFDEGRATKGAALALKARVLLYAASDLHHNTSSYAPAFSNPELLGYTGGNQLDKWREAKNAAQDVIDLGIYDLYESDPGATDSIAQNFVDYFTSESETEEDILLQYFSTKTNEDWSGYNPALYCGPNGYHNWGNNTPLGDLVDDYEMSDGSKFDWTNPVHKANPYVNRDQRLYATILYEGVQWRTRPSDALEYDPYSKIQTGMLYTTSGALLNGGMDTRKGPIEDWNGGFTGYYVRKFIDPTLDPQYVKQEVPFRHIRYAEVLLNYAEASIELSEEDDARDAINLIRKRAGQPKLDATVTGTALMERYRNERRIELAYEDHRLWDVRRWVMGEAAYHQTHSVEVKYITETTSDDADWTRYFIPPANYTGTRKQDRYRTVDGSTWGNPIFNTVETPSTTADIRSWNPKCYFFPIYRNEMNKNTLLIQNPGY